MNQNKTNSCVKASRINTKGLLPNNIRDILTALRKAGNDAVHSGLNPWERAEILLRTACSLGVWFMEVYGDWRFTPPPHQKPENRSDADGYAEQLKAQEKKLKELSEQTAEIKTAVSGFPRGERREKSRDRIRETAAFSGGNGLPGRGTAPHGCLSTAGRQFCCSAKSHPRCRVRNPSNRDLEHIDLRAASDLPVFLPYSKHLEFIPAGTSCVIKDIKLLLNAQLLAGLTEKASGFLEITLSSEDVLPCGEKAEVTVLAFDERHGYTLYPELLTAFVTPNHPEIVKLNARAARLLEEWTKDPSFDAYQSRDPNRILAQAAAVYGALQEQNIVYSVPPASFERFGQRESVQELASAPQEMRERVVVPEDMGGVPGGCRASSASDFTAGAHFCRSAAGGNDLPGSDPG